MDKLDHQQNKKKLHGYEFWHSIGSPKYVCAPMEHQSELPFRLLTKRYGCQLTYTPMIHSRLTSESDKYLDGMFSTCEGDRPVFAQFCGHDPDILLAAAKKVQSRVDAVDINLGCPQGIAKKGHYGAFLLTESDLIVKLVRKLHENLDIPVTCKIRILPDEQQTLELALKIQEAGCSVLTVHGRTKEQNKERQGSANWEMIRKIKQALHIPVIANGNIASFGDVQRCLEETQCDAVMSSEALLEYPALFSGEQLVDLDDLCLEYLEICNTVPAVGGNMKAHVYKFLYKAFRDPANHDLRDQLGKVREYDEIVDIVKEVKRRRTAIEPGDKIGWYYRFRIEEEARLKRKSEAVQQQHQQQPNNPESQQTQLSNQVNSQQLIAPALSSI